MLYEFTKFQLMLYVILVLYLQHCISSQCDRFNNHGKPTICTKQRCHNNCWEVEIELPIASFVTVLDRI